MISLNYTSEKDSQRNEIQNQVEEFLKKGGQINQLDYTANKNFEVASHRRANEVVASKRGAFNGQFAKNSKREQRRLAFIEAIRNKCGRTLQSIANEYDYSFASARRYDDMIKNGEL
jgi:hypothetical protein